MAVRFAKQATKVIPRRGRINHQPLRLLGLSLTICRIGGHPVHPSITQYFTAAERRGLKAIPENDVTSEIQLLRVLPARSFAQVPRTSTSKKRAPLPLKLHIDLLSAFSRVATVIGNLVGLHKKMHRNDVGDLILQALREMNPYEDLELKHSSLAANSVFLIPDSQSPEPDPRFPNIALQSLFSYVYLLFSFLFTLCVLRTLCV